MRKRSSRRDCGGCWALLCLNWAKTQTTVCLPLPLPLTLPLSLQLLLLPSLFLRFAAGRFSKSFVFIGNKVGGLPIEGLCHMSHALIYISKSKQLTVLLRNPTIPTRECNNNQKKRDRERVSSSIFRSFFRLRAHIIKNNKNLRRF